MGPTCTPALALLLSDGSLEDGECGQAARPDVAVAFDHIAAAGREAGLYLSVTSGFRSDAE